MAMELLDFAQGDALLANTGYDADAFVELACAWRWLT